jgi:hypothetical protein
VYGLGSGGIEDSRSVDGLDVEAGAEDDCNEEDAAASSGDGAAGFGMTLEE